MARNSSREWDRETDVLVVGSGGSGLVAALRASESAEVLVLEKAPGIGGTTAVSGGGLWLPNSRPIVDAGAGVPREDVRTYMRQIVGDRIPDDFIETFLDTAPELVDYLEAETALEFQATGFPDYHVDMEGASEEGHMVEPSLFDSNRLGEAADDVRDDPHHPLPATTKEVYESGGHARFSQVADFDELEARAEDGLMSTGNALIAGLYEACLDRGVTFETEAPAKRLVSEGQGAGERVVGAVAEIDGEEVRIRAGAVVLATGGIEWNEEMVENFLRGPMTGPATPPYSEGDGVEMGMSVGANLGNMNEAWWFPTAHIPGEEWEDGSPIYRMVWGPRTLPGSIMVNESGERFTDEAGNYHDLGKVLHDFDPTEYEYENIPAFAIMDQSYRDRYRILSVGPEDDDPDWLTTAETLEGLAEQLGIDADGLVQTVTTFNEHAREHEDPEYQRGQNAYDHFVGDPQAEHPNLAPLDEPPYYAIEIEPGSIGTKGGLVTTTDGEVLAVDDDMIPGLFAASNGTRHVMGIGYAGAGATLGPNAVFGYRAGRSAAEYAT